VGRTCSTHGGYDYVYGCFIRTPGRRGQLEDLGAGGSLISTSILKLNISCIIVIISYIQKPMHTLKCKPYASFRILNLCFNNCKLLLIIELL
jgi:hypothetical protein